MAGFKVNKTGRSILNVPAKKRDRDKMRTNESFAKLPFSLLHSPAMFKLSNVATRALLRLIAEHLAHGGAENGRLIVTHRDLFKFGIPKNRVRAALVELERLGFIQRAFEGMRVHGAFRGAAATYR